MKCYENVLVWLRAEPKTWLITGVAGVIGSNLLEHLLRLDRRVVGLGNFSTGKKNNLQGFKPGYRDVRPGDVLQSQADIGKAKKLLDYAPPHTVDDGLDEALSWYMARFA